MFRLSTYLLCNYQIAGQQAQTQQMIQQQQAQNRQMVGMQAQQAEAVDEKFQLTLKKNPKCSFFLFETTFLQSIFKIFVSKFMFFNFVWRDCLEPRRDGAGCSLDCGPDGHPDGYVCVINFTLIVAMIIIISSNCQLIIIYYFDIEQPFYFEASNIHPSNHAQN